MRVAIAALGLSLCVGSFCVGCDDPSPADDAGPGPTDAGDAANDAGARTDAGGADAGGELDAGGSDAGAPLPCTWDDLRAPPAGTVIWPDELNGTGMDTLGGHGHDDGRGPVGFCAGTPVSGQPFFRLIAVGFETDTDVNGDGDQGDPLPVDFWRDPSGSAVGESAGRINVYIEVVDERGDVLNRFSAPEIRYVRDIRDGPTETFGLTDKPPNEFQTNFPMFGGSTFAVEIEGASDRVQNMRLPVNHHVTFAVVFQREMTP